MLTLLTTVATTYQLAYTHSAYITLALLVQLYIAKLYLQTQ